MLQASPAGLSCAAGRLIISGPAALDEHGQPALDELGIVPCGPSPYTHTFLRPEEHVADGMADWDMVMYEPGFRMAPGTRGSLPVPDCRTIFRESLGAFQRTRIHPARPLSKYAAAIQNGRTITFAVPILEAFGKHANVGYRQILGNCIDLLLPRPLIRDQGPRTWRRRRSRKGPTWWYT